MLVLEENSQPGKRGASVRTRTPPRGGLLGPRGWDGVVLCCPSQACGTGCAAVPVVTDSHRLALPRGALLCCGSLGCAGLAAAGLCWMRGCAVLIWAASALAAAEQPCSLCGMEDAVALIARRALQVPAFNKMGNSLSVL